MSATTILAAGELASWGAVSMAITGSADWDTALFAELKAGTLTESQAKALWTYTDGYQVRITATTDAVFNPGMISPIVANSVATPAGLTGTAAALARVTEMEYNYGCAGQPSQAATGAGVTADAKNNPRTLRMPGMYEAFRNRSPLTFGAAVTTATLIDQSVQSPLSWPPTYCPPQDQPSRTQAEVDADGVPPTPCQRCRQTFCVTKLTPGNSATNYDDRKANAGRAADGYYCFEMDRARMDFMQYWPTAALAATSGVASGTKAAWEVTYVKGRAVDRKVSRAESAAERDPANPYNNQAAIFGGTSGGVANTGNTASITQALQATDTGTIRAGESGQALEAASAPSLAAGVGKLDVRWYQPKWQKNDYYKNNFRINYADTVRVRYCNPLYDWPGTGGVVTQTEWFSTSAAVASELPTGGGYRHGGYTGATTAALTATGFRTRYPPPGGSTTLAAGVPYPAATGMLAEVVPKGAHAQASTCYWKNQDTVVVAPKNGAAALFASVSAIAFGAAVLAI